MMPMLSTRALSCGYAPGIAVLSRLDLTVPRGAFVCIIGPNGVGKSTLARTLAGLQTPLSGSVALGGRPLEELPPAERARMLSVVLTRLPNPGYMTVRSFIGIGRHPYTGTLGRMSPADHGAVSNAMRQVGIAELADRWMGEISDGERQRAAVARAFAQSAALMILDEPTAFLDVESRAEVMTTLRALAHETGRTVVATSHDIEMVLRIADEVWMIPPDRTVLTGAPEDLVLAGALDQVFPHHVMAFDPGSGTFRLPSPTGDSVAVVGDGPAAVWTARALERIGKRVRIATGSAAAASEDPEVRVLRDSAGSVHWLLRIGGTEETFDSIGSVVDSIRGTVPPLPVP